MLPDAVANRRKAIFAAVLQTLASTGYDRLTMDAVASCARASKATLYRHWAGKAQLVEDALRHCDGQTVALPDTGSVRGDLLAALTSMVDGLRDQDLSMIQGLLTAIHAEPDLADWLRGHLVDDRCAAARTWAAREVDRGRLPAGADLDLVTDVAGSMVLMRLLVTGQPVDLAYLERIVDDVVLPLLFRTTQYPGEHADDRNQTAADRPRVGEPART